jgi:hypothetical protein
MFCPKCSQTVNEGSRFCMHCGFNLTPEEAGEMTMVEGVEATACEKLEDYSEKTKVIMQESFQRKSKKVVKTQKPLFFAWLVSLGGTDKGRDYRITKEKTTIGKSEESEIVIRNDFISRNHAILFYEKDKFILNDLESTNYTFVNDKKISRRILKDNDLIKFGEATCKFKCL